MTQENILIKLKEQKNFIQETYEVDKIGIFGSYAKNKQTQNSDIDIYVEFHHKTFDNLAGLWNFLENLYQKKIDLIHKHKNNNQVIINNIQKEVIYG
ncbi:MAG: nucleotidyltransferase domain-containing protein [Campylobacterota bacterium]|nr:nucleotidyltransferase domain-containing protein [Campylobacterota bacterium]